MTALGRSHNCCRLLCAAATADHGGRQRPRGRSRLPDEARRATALMVLDTQTGQPKGILTVADIAHAVADGKDLNEIRIRELTTIRPTVKPATHRPRRSPDHDPRPFPALAGLRRLRP